MIAVRRLLVPVLLFATGVLLSPVAHADGNPGDVWSWGLNRGGQLGDGTTEVRNTPVKVPELPQATSVAGGLLHSVAVLADGTVRAWGNNDLGQLGNSTNDESYSPVAVVGIHHGIAVAAGFEHTVVLKSDGTVWSWGGNRYGQLGNGSTSDSASPVQVAGLDRITDVAAGGYHNLARRSDGTVWFWGTPGLGGAGFQGAQVNLAPVPVQLPAPPGVTDIAAGIDHDLMLKDGAVYSWGTNQYGQLGDGSSTAKPSGFVQARGIRDIAAIAAGGFHSLAVAQDGKVYSWGWNGSAQLGNGTTTNSAVPGEIKGLKAASVAAGWYHNLAIATDGSLWYWGDNLFGKLGDGSFKLSLVPRRIDGFGPVLAVAAAADHSLAVKGQPPVTQTTGAKANGFQSPNARTATLTK